MIRKSVLIVDDTNVNRRVVSEQVMAWGMRTETSGSGVDALRDVKGRIGIPVLGLGGIRMENIPDVMQAGADGVAMISAIFAADDIQAAAQGIVLEMKR